MNDLPVMPEPYVFNPEPRPHLTTDQHRVTLAYIRELAVAMKLQNWEIDLRWTPAPDDCMARVQTTAQILHAWIEIGGYNRAAHTLAYPKEDIRRTLVHELLHLHFSAVDEVALQHIQNVRLLTDDGFSMYNAAYKLSMETAVHLLSLVLAPFMPLPEFGVEL